MIKLILLFPFAIYGALHVLGRVSKKCAKYAILSFEMYLATAGNMASINFVIFSLLQLEASVKECILLLLAMTVLGTLIVLIVSEPGRLPKTHTEKLSPNPLFYDVCDKCELRGKIYHSSFSQCCVAEFDHTCSFIANDIGKQNRFIFLIYTGQLVLLGVFLSTEAFFALRGRETSIFYQWYVIYPLVLMLVGLSYTTSGLVLLLFNLELICRGHTPSSELKCAEIKKLIKSNEVGIFETAEGLEFFKLDSEDDQVINDGDQCLERLPRNIEISATQVGPYGKGLKKGLARVFRDMKFECRYCEDYTEIYE